MNNNFTTDKKYRNSLYYRFPIKNIKSSENIDVIRYYDGNNCFQYFDFPITKADLNLLERINKYSKIKFRNINKDSNAFRIISSNFDVEITQEWDSPILYVKKKEFDTYVKEKSNDFRRLIKKHNIFSKQLTFKISNKKNKEDLWKDILYIDQSSWKREEQSDMMNLYYEHISCLSQINNSIIEIAYLQGEPIAYSLLYLFNGIYYAAKWGATQTGREYNAGIICLLNQIKRISNKEDMYLDLWGRNNKIYDRLKTNSIKRIYFTIKKNGSKKD